ncbi:MAG: septum formation inhibitor Maf [Rhizobiales bacterium]|nr:septum formation inhibitor Maf [Hyphomicrobiales bacterium]
MPEQAAFKDARPLVLASGSRARRMMLEGAGLVFEVVPADIDEAFLRDNFLDDNPGASAGDVAELLAQAKAATVSEVRRGTVAVGSDQVLVLEGRLFEKPGDMEDAADRLLAMAGKTHELHSAVAIAVDGVVEWSHTEVAYLTMRRFDAAFVGRYLAAAGPSVLSSVGAYALERHGPHLFDRIDGDYFTILGMPLLALLKRLREQYGITIR